MAFFQVEGYLLCNESNGRNVRRYFGLSGKLFQWWPDKKLVDKPPVGSISLELVRDLHTELILGHPAFIMQLVDGRRFIFQGETKQTTDRFTNVLRATWDALNRRSGGFGSARGAGSRRDSAASDDSSRDNHLKVSADPTRRHSIRNGQPLLSISTASRAEATPLNAISGPCSPLPMMNYAQSLGLGPSDLAAADPVETPPTSGRGIGGFFEKLTVGRSSSQQRPDHSFESERRDVSHLKTGSTSSVGGSSSAAAGNGGASSQHLEKKSSWTSRLINTFTSFGSSHHSTSSPHGRSGTSSSATTAISTNSTNSLASPATKDGKDAKSGGFGSPAIVVDIAASRYPSTSSISSNQGDRSNAAKKSASVAPLSVSLLPSSGTSSSNMTGPGTGSTGSSGALGMGGSAGPQSRSSTYSSNRGETVLTRRHDSGLVTISSIQGGPASTGRILRGAASNQDAVATAVSGSGIIPHFSSSSSSRPHQPGSLASGGTSSSSGPPTSSSRGGSGIFTQQDPFVLGGASTAPTAAGHPAQSAGGSGLYLPETVGGSELYGDGASHSSSSATGGGGAILGGNSQHRHSNSFNTAPGSGKPSPSASVNGALIFAPRGNSASSVNGNAASSTNVSSIFIHTHDPTPIPPSDIAAHAAAAPAPALRLNLSRAWQENTEDSKASSSSEDQPRRSRQSALPRLSEGKEDSSSSSDSKDDASYDGSSSSSTNGRQAHNVSLLRHATGVDTPLAGEHTRESGDVTTGTSSSSSAASSHSQMAAVTKVDSDDQLAQPAEELRGGIPVGTTVTGSANATRTHTAAVQSLSPQADAGPTLVHHRESTDGDFTGAALAGLISSESKEEPPITVGPKQGLKALMTQSLAASASGTSSGAAAQPLASVKRSSLSHTVAKHPGLVASSSSSGGGEEVIHVLPPMGGGDSPTSYQ